METKRTGIGKDEWKSENFDTKRRVTRKRPIPSLPIKKKKQTKNRRVNLGDYSVFRNESQSFYNCLRRVDKICVNRHSIGEELDSNQKLNSKI